MNKYFLYISLIAISILGLQSVQAQTFKNLHSSKIVLVQDPDSAYSLTIQSSSPNSNISFTLPTTAPPDNYFLKSDGAGNLSWDQVSVSSSPGGITGSVQYFKNSALGGDSLFVYDSTRNSLYVGAAMGTEENSLVTPNMYIGKDGTSGELKLRSQNSSNYFTLKPKTSQSQNLSFEMPATNGTYPQALISDGSGELSWGGNISVGPTSENNTNSDNTVESDATNGYIGGGEDNEVRDDSENSGVYGGDTGKIDYDVVSSVVFGGIESDIDDAVFYSVLFGGNYIDHDEGVVSSAIAGGLEIDIDSDALYNVIMAGEENNIDDDSQSNAVFAGYYNHEDNGSEPSDFTLSMAGHTIHMFHDYNASVGGRDIYFSDDSDADDIVTRSVNFGGNNNRIELGNAMANLAGRDNDMQDDDRSIILGGFGNDTRDSDVTILNGYENDAIDGGQYTFIGGRTSETDDDYQISIGYSVEGNNNHDYTILFGDSNTNTLDSDDDREWQNRFSSGYRLFTNTALTTGVQMNANASSWSSVSDSTKKTSILELNYRTIAHKIQQLGIYSWNYIGSDSSIRNYSPMAQDFYQLFGQDQIGIIGSDTTIAELDLSSILLAGVKGAQYELKDTKTKIGSLKRKSKALESRIEEIRNKLDSIQEKE